MPWMQTTSSRLGAVQQIVTKIPHTDFRQKPIDELCAEVVSSETEWHGRIPDHHEEIAT
jgi:hypothetical protein